MRAVVAVLIAGLAGGCVTAGAGGSGTRTLAGDWKIDRRSDPVLGATVGASVSASRVNSRTKIFAGPAGVQLICFKNEPIVRLRFDDRIGANRSTSFAYRTDSADARRPGVRILQDYRTIMIEDRADVAAFAKDIEAASELHVSIESLTTVGKTTAMFPVRGAADALKAAYADCPVVAAR